MNDASPSRRRWLRFSLRIGMLLVVAAAIAGSMWATRQQRTRVAQVEAENLALRNELGYLTIDKRNENKLHAIAVPTLESNTWKFRIHVPPGKPFHLHAAEGRIPRIGFQTDGGGSVSSLMVPGQQSLTVAVRQNAKKQFEWVVKTKSGGGLLMVSRDQWLKRGATMSETEGVGHLVTMTAGQPLVLLRHRVFSGNITSSTQTATMPGDGILVWISDR